MWLDRNGGGGEGLFCGKVIEPHNVLRISENNNATSDAGVVCEFTSMNGKPEMSNKGLWFVG